MKCIISCEHASNRVPPCWAHLFAGKKAVLATHQAYDPGAAGLARGLSRRLQASVHLGTITRLLIDLNRSPTNRKSLFTPYSRKLGPNDREQLLQKYYQPYREKIVEEIGGTIAQDNPVLHISVHSFAPALRGKVRKADIGLLYDPARRPEKGLCAFLAGFLRGKMVPSRVRRNYPYLGITDGLTSFLREKYVAKMYAGIEIEINQKLLEQKDECKMVEAIFAEGLGKILQANNFFQLEDHDGSRRKQ